MDADVIISGAGMAGATLALGLARGGLKPLLVDAQPFEARVARFNVLPPPAGQMPGAGFSAQWR